MTVIWLTGLSGSGKSTVASLLANHLKTAEISFEHLDGDSLREQFPAGFTRSEREIHIKRVAFIASLLEKHGVTVIVSLISPYKKSREEARSLCKNFVEVYVSTPLEVCEKRDVKGFYKKARTGEVANFTGISDPYEEPDLPELTLNCGFETAEESLSTLVRYLKKRDTCHETS